MMSFSEMRPTVEFKPLHEKVRSGEWDIGYKSQGAAAIDLLAAIDHAVTIVPGSAPTIIPSGIALWIRDPGLVGIMVPRSGLGVKGLVLGNLVGVIDSDYQGEIKVAAWNRNEVQTDPMIIRPGDRIAQLLIVPVIRPAFSIVSEFSNQSERGEGGFGSTGRGKEWEMAADYAAWSKAV